MVKSPPANAGDVGSIPGSGGSPEKEMATHSSILAWEIPGTEEPGKLQSKGSQRVRSDLGLNNNDKQQYITFCSASVNCMIPPFCFINVMNFLEYFLNVNQPYLS